jgi:hypothetical protein
MSSRRLRYPEKPPNRYIVDIGSQLIYSREICGGGLPLDLLDDLELIPAADIAEAPPGRGRTIIWRDHITDVQLPR